MSQLGVWVCESKTLQQDCTLRIQRRVTLEWNWIGYLLFLIFITWFHTRLQNSLIILIQESVLSSGPPHTGIHRLSFHVTTNGHAEFVAKEPADHPQTGAVYSTNTAAAVQVYTIWRAKCKRKGQCWGAVHTKKQTKTLRRWLLPRELKYFVEWKVQVWMCKEQVWNVGEYVLLRAKWDPCRHCHLTISYC